MAQDCAKKEEKFVDLDRCLDCIDKLLCETNRDISREAAEAERLFEDFKKIIDTYLQLPELLDPHIQTLILRLTSGLTNLRKQEPRYHGVFKFLYQIIKVSGFKEVGIKFPHETDKLHIVVDLLELEDPSDKANWETRFVLTVWLSIVILTPFDLKKFDSSDDESISDRIYATLMRSFALHDSCQQVTAFCLAKFFSRTDILRSANHLDRFISLALEEVASAKTEMASSTDDIKLIGYLRTLAYMYKFLPRSEMKARSQAILDSLSKLDFERIDRVLVSHLLVKVIQRAGLSLLPAREATWRYKRASRVLGQIKGSLDDKNSLEPGNKSTAQTQQAVSNEEEAESAEHLEFILSYIFMAAQNLQTKVRWSAAKGIARSTGRLSKERAGDVIDMVLENFFKPDSSEYAWHGGCLTLAEMSRHGLIPETKLDRVTKVVRDAIVYEKLKGSMATGAHIREAACYICWAISRTYDDQLLSPFLSTISINLLCVMLFDRELQCRRAASAAFQELVGRQGTFSEEEIEILTSLDYHNVGQRQLTFVQLAPSVASYGEKYAKPFVEHLISCKVGHWDIEIRHLASDSLSSLMLHLSKELIQSHVLSNLMEMSNQTDDVNLRHGSIIGLAKVLRALVPLQFVFDNDIIEHVGSLAAKCEKQLANKPQASKFIEAICQLILSAESARFSFHEDSQTLEQWESIVLAALDSDDMNIRKVGSQAFLALYRTYFGSNKTIQDRLLAILNKTLQSANESSRCGALMSLAKLSQAPSRMIGDIRRDADTIDIILMSLTSYISKDTYEAQLDSVFAEAKAQACESFVELIYHMDDVSLVTSSALIGAGYDALLIKTEDYTFSKKGDIGVVVRRAAIKSLKDLTSLLLNRNKKTLLTPHLVERLVAKILQQAVSYNDSAREQAGQALYEIISCELPDEKIPHKIAILDLFKKYEVNDTFDWRNHSTPILVRLLAKQEYSHDLWFGLMSSVGQLSPLGAKQFKVALADYIRDIDRVECKMDREQVFGSFMSTLEKIELTDRSLMPALATVEFLLTECLIDEEICADRLAKFCWTRRGNGDPKRLIAIARVLSLLLQYSGNAQIKALKCCLVLLASGYAKVRTSMAEQLYSSILMNQSDLESTLGSCMTEAMDLLSLTNWSEPLDKVKAVRDDICRHMKLSPSSLQEPL